MTAFAITTDDEERIVALRTKAEAAENIVRFRAMVDRVRRQSQGEQVAGFSDFTIRLDLGWEVTYTVEEHREGVPCRHISMSSPRPGKTPLPLAMQFIMDRFGFVHSLADPDTGEPLPHPAVYVETLQGGGGAINVIEPISGQFDALSVHPREQ